MSDPRPVAVFDSGIGGLTVLRALRLRLPGESFLYLGDTARVPYGTRSDETVVRYAREALAFLGERGVKAVVVACNTVSAVALRSIASETELPLVGVLEPVAAEACRRSSGGRIGVIGTPATVRSAAYPETIRRIRMECTVLQAACPLFVPLAEEGWTGGAVPQLVAETYLTDLRRAGVDTLILGCTHYPVLRDVVAATMGPEVELLDSAESAADEAGRLLEERGLRAGKDAGGEDHFYVTDSSERFREVGERFLGEAIERLELVSLPTSGAGGGA